MISNYIKYYVFSILLCLGISKLFLGIGMNMMSLEYWFFELSFSLPIIHILHKIYIEDRKEDEE